MTDLLIVGTVVNIYTERTGYYGTVSDITPNTVSLKWTRTQHQGRKEISVSGTTVISTKAIEAWDVFPYDVEDNQ